MSDTREKQIREAIEYYRIGIDYDIFRDSVKEHAKLAIEALEHLLANTPTVDAVEVVHGRWDKYDCYKCNSDGKPVIRTGNVFVCSVCGREERYREPYCHCGAKMDGDGNG